MTREEIPALADPTTFQPFTIVTGSGQRFRVPHADFIDIPPMPDDEDEEGRLHPAPSYVTVYGKSAIPRFIVLANISAVEFHKEPA
jgi:hypothetical protein